MGVTTYRKDLMAIATIQTHALNQHKGSVANPLCDSNLEDSIQSGASDNPYWSTDSLKFAVWIITSIFFFITLLYIAYGNQPGMLTFG